ncbi:hypothetical protein BT67DRAFT_383277 [Trichocladium antarcticum]|uniref:MINDY deubiquitinase domain-containing protein n=1 Tax=Trichocladium antarcticum TaxID=1450529 RepID=A0AAN6UI05_9PEZI|nr:hypothetical protein BT67DRAFT_383277 [Trichocladium antarcticum]
MVARKPLPDAATFDPAVPPQARDRSPNPGAASIWRDEVAEHHGHQGGDALSSLGPGAPPVSGYGEETSVWARGNPALEIVEAEYENGAPVVIRPGGGGRNEVYTAPGADALAVPAVLRPGGGSPKPETNPFKRKMSLSSSATGSQGQLGNQATGSNAPFVPSVPDGAFSQLSVNDTSNNPWQPALEVKKDVTGPPVPRLFDQESLGDNVWDSGKPSRQPTPGPAASPALVSLPSEDGSAAGWDEEPKMPTIPPALITTAAEESLEDPHAWDDLGAIDKGKGRAQGPPVPSKESEDWSLVGAETQPLSRQSTWENFDGDGNPTKKAAMEPKTEEVAPQLPPRRSADKPLPSPQRPVDKSETYQIKKIGWHDSTATGNPRTSPILVQNANGPCPLVALVNALTLTTPADMSGTALVETLRTREQVSLGLLLDAVFEELMSERRTKPDVPLPDVGELYNFLQGLHTGMNVNPRFIPAPDVVTAFRRTSLTHLHPTERTDMIPGTFEHTTEMNLYSTFSIPLIHGWIPSKDDAVYDAFARQAASYEDAQNMLFREEELEEKLSSSHSQGLTPEEQQVYQDILTIKSFLSISATQLTQFGLDVIKTSMKPGSVAILFRNDHFSTLYRHPQTQGLFILVTDAGYAGHAEVVWESLVDINGERAEFFSGDFRPVGGATHGQSSGGRAPGNRPDAASDDADNSSWTSVQGHRGRSHASQPSNSSQPPLSPNTEQEDRDLALALQLQEEEDERHRIEQDRHRRESLLSEQFIEQQARAGIAPTAASLRGGRGSTASLLRGGSNARGASTTSLSPSTPTPANPTANRPRPTTQTVRSLIPPRSQPTTTNNIRPANANAGARGGRGEDDDVPPPTYEQAAKQLPYLPPAGHPSHPASSPRAETETETEPPRRPPPSPLGAGGPPGPGSPSSLGRGGAGAYPGGLRRGVPPSQGVSAGMGRERERERDCVVM